MTTKRTWHVCSVKTKGRNVVIEKENKMAVNCFSGGTCKDISFQGEDSQLLNFLLVEPREETNSDSSVSVNSNKSFRSKSEKEGIGAF